MDYEQAIKELKTHFNALIWCNLEEANIKSLHARLEKEIAKLQIIVFLLECEIRHSNSKSDSESTK